MKLLVDTSQIVVKKYFKVRQRNRIKVNYEEWKKNNKERNICKDWKSRKICKNTILQKHSGIKTIKESRI